MSRSANFFAQSFTPATPSPSTSSTKLSYPISLSTLLKPNDKPSLSDLSSRLDEAVAALSQHTEESNFSSSSDDYTSDSHDEEWWEEGFSTPSSSVSSITNHPLKPALRSTPSTGSNNGRKASFSEEPPKVARTYSASEYSRAGPQPKKMNYKVYLEALEQNEVKECIKDTLVEDREKEEAEEQQHDDMGFALCRFPSNSKRGENS